MVSLLVTGVASRLDAQRFDLRAHLSDTTFFEGEPVYLTIELRNMGKDTAWVQPLGHAEGTLRGVLLNELGDTIPEFAYVVDRVSTAGYRGTALAGGSSLLETLVLNLRWGFPAGTRQQHQRNFYLLTLPPGTYSLRTSLRVGAGQVSAAVLSAERRFVVRGRTPDQGAQLQGLKELGNHLWDRGRRSSFVRTMEDWCRSALTRNNRDPFVPFLLKEGMAVATGVGIKATPSERDVLLDLQLTVARTNATSPVGALMTLSGPLRDSSRDLTVLASDLGESLVALAARHQRDRR